MEYGDADPAVRVDVGVEDLGGELHLGRVQRVVLWEAQLCNKNSILKRQKPSFVTSFMVDFTRVSEYFDSLPGQGTSMT
jgi:hypothetical protein